MRVYRYVGPKSVAEQSCTLSGRVRVKGGADVIGWVDGGEVSREWGEELVATFIVDVDGELWVADRRSEHVACARGGDVLSAGEMTFRIEGGDVRVIEASNQSTGYCPEPESWAAVGAALDRAGISHLGGFTMEIIFRRCDACGETNIVKDGWFECGVCGEGLSEAWNFGPL